MRVITGSAKGRKLKTLEGLDVRPTTDRVKEAVFSIIQFQLPGAVVLDLFAGSGQMGIEALSRGAKLAVFVDADRRAQEIVRENLKTTGLSPNSRVAAMDAQAFVSSTKDVFDIAFLDPPYRKGLLDEVLPKLADKMSDTGVILCEHGKDEELPQRAGEFLKARDYRYGKIVVTAYRKPQDEE